VTCIAVGGIVEPEAAAALAELGAGTLQQGDLEAAGAELAARLLRGGRL
jgi:hypothetical protein